MQPEHAVNRMGGKRNRPLPPFALLPGLALALALNLSAVTGRPVGGIPEVLAPLLYGLIPVVALIGWRLPPAALGIIRHRAGLDFGWGLVWGGVWRIGSMGLNYLYSATGLLLSFDLAGVPAAVLMPALEELFFRGYLGRGLVAYVGRWWGLLLQALMFTLLPSHWDQGLPHVAVIFLFGLLAGWLVDRSRSLWPAVGAHMFANVLTLLLAATMA